MKCDDMLCQDFMREVPPDHRHWRRCEDAGCRFFGQFTAPEHRHWHSCADDSCRDFQQFVPPGHQHRPWLRNAPPVKEGLKREANRET